MRCGRRWVGLGKAGPGPKPAFAKNWGKAFVSLRLTETVQMKVSHVALDFRRRDLRGVGDFWWGTPSLGDEIFFLGLGRLLGVGIAYVTSFENFASFLFGVVAVSFIFCRRVAFLFHAAAAYMSGGEGFGGVPTLGSGSGCG